MENLYGKDRHALEGVVAPLCGKPFHARQLFEWLYSRGERDFARMSDLPRALRDSLQRSFRAALPAVELAQTSSDGTIKYLLRLDDGKAVESVYIPEKRRITFCISSQIGCPLGCAFCLTARMGLVRNLTPGEIAGQAALLAQSHRLPPNGYNLVFMGMGEPLNNSDNVMGAFQLLTDPRGMGIAPRHITLSTAGVVPGILKLAKEPSRPRLAVSLSATTDAQRDALMPINRAYPLQDLFAALRTVPLGARERITLEYVLLRGINDTREDAARLARLAGGLPIKINLIPYNDAAVAGYDAPRVPAARAFRDLLIERRIPASLRRRRGADISAACGQLAILDTATLEHPPKEATHD